MGFQETSMGSLVSFDEVRLVHSLFSEDLRGRCDSFRFHVASCDVCFC